MLRRCGWVVGLLMVVHQGAEAQQWARDMFPVKSHSFGVVARGAKTEYRFELQNQYAVDVHIAGVRTSCGCTTPTVTRQTLKTYQKGAVLATFNTGSFQGDRRATLTVMFDQPRYAEVQLQVRGRIRGDLELVPSAISFGPVEQGKTPSKTVQVLYHGNARWQVVEVRGGDDFVDVELQPMKSRTGQTVFRLTARLKPDAPAGYFNDQLTLVTNDRGVPYLPVHVDGQVRASLTVSPASLFLGAVPPGQKVTRKLVVRAKRPFKIVGIQPSDARFSFAPSDDAKTVHLVPMTFTAGANVAKITETISVETDLDDGTIAHCTVSAAVVDPVANK